MKYIKMLGLLAVAAAALMAFAGSASATLTSGGSATWENMTIHAESEGATSLTGTITITCQKSPVHGSVSNNGSTTASGQISALTFEECGNHTVTVVKKGELTVHSLANNTGTVTSTGAEVTVLLHSFLLGTVHCIYTTNATDIGTLTGSGHGSNTTATLDINSVSIPRTPTDGACGEHSTWEGSYSVTTPDNLTID